MSVLVLNELGKYSVCLCCNKTHNECKFSRHNQPDGHPCERHDDSYEELEEMLDWKTDGKGNLIPRF